MNTQSIEKAFLSEFELNWHEAIDTYGIKQIQLEIGSRLRPLMVLWGYLATCDNFHSVNVSFISNIAVSIELLHKASILLDDWIDEDAFRHGEKAFHTEYDPSCTVILSLHMVCDSIIRLKKYLPSSSSVSNGYYIAADIVANTIFSMSKGALEELKLGKKCLNLDTINRIAQLETAEIIGNSLQLGYFVGNGSNTALSGFFKKMGDKFGYLFQAFNDLEVFTNKDMLLAHKQKLNTDVAVNRKNIAIATLFNVSDACDKELVETANYYDLVRLLQKYKIRDYYIEQMNLFFDTLPNQIDSFSLSTEWKEGFMSFVQSAKSIALEKLGM